MIAVRETVQDGTAKVRHLTLGDGSKIVERFNSHEASEADAQAAISGVYTGGFAALIEKFGAA